MIPKKTLVAYKTECEKRADYFKNDRLTRYHKIKSISNGNRTEWSTICNGNRTEWSPIRSVIIRVRTKSDDRAAGVRFVYDNGKP